MNVRAAIPPADLIAVLYRCGWRTARQHGDHLILENAAREEILTVPLHEVVKPQVVLTILDAAGIEQEEFDHFSAGPSAPLAGVKPRPAPTGLPSSLRGLMSR